MISIINKNQKISNIYKKQINNIYFTNKLINNIYKNNNKLYFSSNSTTTAAATITNKKQFKIKNSGEIIVLGKKSNSLNYGNNKFIEEFNYPYDDILPSSSSSSSINSSGTLSIDSLMVQPKTSYKDKLEVFDEVLSISMDEAGKGALLGPLFISCVVLDNESEKYLRSMGVTDSKKLSPKRREYLYDIIIEHALYYQTIVLTSEKIDQRRELHTMNQIETNLFYQLIKDSINNLPKNQQCKIIIDSIEMNTTKYSQPFKIQFPPPLYQIYCETKADHKFISVGAASIIAKVERDRWMKQLESNTSQIIGSGYPSDPLTINYVNNFFKKNYIYPNSMRKSWKFTGADKEFDNLSSTLDNNNNNNDNNNNINNKNIIDQDDEDDELLSLIHKQKERENNLLNLELQQSFSSASSQLIENNLGINNTTSSHSSSTLLTKQEQKELLRKEKEALKLEKENKRKEKQIEREKNKQLKLESKQNKPPTTKQILDLLLLKLNNLESKIEQIQKKQDIIDLNNNNNNNNNNINNNNNNNSNSSSNDNNNNNNDDDNNNK
ncbi:hypothetical protein ACTFIU_009617 [Dictyostelium citrinum]